MKIRLDLLLVDKGFATGRDKAKSLIIEEQVLVNNKIISKPSELVDENSEIKLTGENLKYVSRGGLKLEKAINSFNINLNDKTCCDIGSSTGGFTDCMLQYGAGKVYAVDVGTNQLSPLLRNNPKVVVKENTNIRYMNHEDIGELIDFISIDVSFISLKLVLPVAKVLLKNDGFIVCLIKPQFEAGAENIGKNGVVNSLKIHERVVNDIVEFVKSLNFKIIDLDFSPIKGPKGNIEFLLYIKNSQEILENNVDIKRIVCNAHNSL